MQSTKRREVIIGEHEAAGWIRDGMTVSIGGFLNSSHPMAAGPRDHPQRA